MDLPPDHTATDAHAKCEDTPQPKDGAQAWLGLAIIVLCALATAAILGLAAWHWLP